MTSPPPLHPKILGDLRSAASPAALPVVTQELARAAARIGLAAIEADAGRFDEARATLGRGPVEPRRLEEHHLRLWYALGDLEERAGRPDDARRWFERVVSAEPGWGDAAEKVNRL